MREAALVAAKDLRIEMRSRVATNQVVPFALLVLVLFAFALDPDRGLLARASGGLFWLAVVFASLLAVQRSFSIEAADGARDGLRLSGLDPAAVFAGKAVALAIQLAVIEAVLGVGIVVLYGADLSAFPAMVLTALLATVGLAAAGTVYGAMSAALQVRETLLPLLILPVVAPVVLAATRVSDLALAGDTAGAGAWLRLLAVFAAVYSALGVLVFGPLMEEA